MQLANTGKRVVNRHGIKFLLGWSIKRVLGMLTKSQRVLPDFIIIGAQRSGSTSLYNYLVKHPGVVPGLMKEMHYFDTHFNKGISWYRSFFPLSSTAQKLERSHQHKIITGESTPYYLFYPHAPRRMQSTIPEIKLIVLLRNPVERAYSHYQHEVKLGLEDLPFGDAIEREKSELPGETSKIMKDENYHSFIHQNYSYLSRGIYIEQLEVWDKYFSMDNMLVLKSEDLFSKPGDVLDQACKFLGIKKHAFSEYQIHNSLPYPDLEPDFHRLLTEYFEPYNNRLYQFLGVDFGWENAKD
jgi:hypothetical protein